MKELAYVLLGMVGQVIFLLAVFGIITLLSGCASERYLTPEQDAEFKARCEAGGCTIVPNDVMLELLKRLQGVRI